MRLLPQWHVFALHDRGLDSRQDANRRPAVNTGRLSMARQLSVVGRGYHTEKDGVGFHKVGGQIQIWENYGAFWGGLWGLSTGGVFSTSP